MSNKLVKPNSICLICGKKGTHNIFLTSGQSVVSATGTQLGNFLYKIICEEPCYSISEVICQQCYLLMDRLDTYQARAEEIHSHISDRYKYTKLGLIGCRKRISDLIVHSLSNIKSFKNGTILNVSDELSVTVFHEALPRPENRVICDRVALNSSQKDRLLQSSHLKQHNSEILRSKAKKRLYLHNSNKSKPIIRNEVQTSMNGNGTDIFDSHKKTNFHEKVSIKRKLPPSLKENAVPKKPKEKFISQLVDSSTTSLLNDHASVCNSVISHQNNSLEIPIVNKNKSININEKCENSEAAQLIYNTLKDVLSNQQSHKLCWPNSNKDISTSEQTQIMETVKDDYLSLSNSPLLVRSPPEEENTRGLKTVDGESSEGENEFDNASSTSIDSVNSSSSSSNESSSTDSSSDSSSISSDDNTSDEENETVELEEKVTNDANLKDSNLLDSKKSLLDNVTDYAILTQNDIKNIKKEIVTDAEKSTNHSEDKISYKKVLKKKIKRQPTNNQSPSPSPSKKKIHVKNSSAHVDTLDPQFAHAVLMQNSLASSLLQSFLSTSLWMNSSESPKKKNTNSLNQNNLKESQNLSSDEIVCDSLSNAVGSINDKEKRLELKNTGQSYINTKGKLVDAKRVLPQDCSRCPLKCNGRLSDEKRREIFTEYWGLADYNLQREYLASHMDREERMGPSGLPRNVILYYLTYKESKIQVCRQFFLKTLDISEKASRLVIEKKLKL